MNNSLEFAWAAIFFFFDYVFYALINKLSHKSSASVFWFGNVGVALVEPNLSYKVQKNVLLLMILCLFFFPSYCLIETELQVAS